MSVFNSLGSNYSLSYVLRTLSLSDNRLSSTKLTQMLEKKYKGKVYLMYKGRQALGLSLRIINSPQKAVGIVGFTCYAVCDAVIKEGYKPVFLDIDDSLNPTLVAIKAAVEKHQDLKVLIIQNTLGYTVDIGDILKFCRSKNIIIIEDLAHCAGSAYEKGEEVGSIGDFTMLSFSQDKVIDAISGGALVVRNSKYSNKLPENTEFLELDQKTYGKDKLYPILTYIIRKTYSIGIGRYLHFFCRRMGVLINPMQMLYDGRIYALPSFHCGLVINSMAQLSKNLEHRRKIAMIYIKYINPKLLNQAVCKNISRSSNLRFPILSKDRAGFIAYLKKKQIYVSDIWYDAPIAPGKYLNKTGYANECPYSEYISSRIVNLPTHINVSEKIATYIARCVNEYDEQ